MHQEGWKGLGLWDTQKSCHERGWDEPVGRSCWSHGTRYLREKLVYSEHKCPNLGPPDFSAIFLLTFHCILLAQGKKKKVDALPHSVGLSADYQCLHVCMDTMHTWVH